MNTGSNAELRITFSRPRLIIREDNTERVAADVQMVYELDSISVAASEAVTFVAPIGLLEAEDIKWYLESYYIWPVGLFKDRAERIEHNFSQWGGQLLESLTAHSSTQAIFQQWSQASEGHEPVLSLQVLPEEMPESNTAASRLLGLPWELLHYQQQYLVDHQPPIRIRRNLPNVSEQLIHRSEQTVIRILAASPRPLKAGYIDHRISIKPLIAAIEDLGSSAELVRVHPPTIEQLEHELQQAEQAGKPFHVVHFDGHGVFDAKTGRGALCFEHKLDNDKLLPEFVKRVYADELAALLSKYQIPLVFLEACQSGQSDGDPNASVAAALLQAGVSSVVAMSHSVLVETAQRFVSSFYQQLAAGQRIGTAVLSGRQSLMEDHDRINIAGAGMLQMQDWFVPLLYQREDDPRLFKSALQVSEVEKPALRLGDLPDTPEHTFVGRSLELLKLERLLELRPYAVIRGMGGQGKTALAVELARWLVKSRRFERCAFVSVEQYTHENAVVEVLLQQLVNAKYNLAAEYGNDVDTALSAIRGVLEQERTLIVVDNMESLLADAENKQAVLDVLARLPEARLLFTTREPLPKPFHREVCEIELDALGLNDAKALVMQVMNHEGVELRHGDRGNTPDEVDDLVNAVGCHARALVLLARELAQRGVTATTENVREIMVELEQRHPGERELSLFASVELSLRRLSPEVREKTAGLVVFHDGGHWNSMAYVLEVDNNTMSQIAEELKQVGLAQFIDSYGYLRLVPAFSTYLKLGLSTERQEIYQQRWQAALDALVVFLYQQKFENIKRQSHLTQLELPNLMVFLSQQKERLEAGHISVEYFVERTRQVEQLLEHLNQHHQALRKIVVWRRQASQKLGGWNQFKAQNEVMRIERLLQGNELQEALAVAKTLLLQCQQAVMEQDYQGSDYYLATAYFSLGRVLRMRGDSAKALECLRQAQQNFELLGEENKNAVQMVSSALIEQSACLHSLGRLEDAAATCSTSVEYNLRRAATREVAVSKSNLVNIHINQGRYTDALKVSRETLQLFQQLNEPSSTAITFTQMGDIYQLIGDYQQAEQAFRQSLVIESQQGNRAGEARNLIGLGNLYSSWKRPEQAVSFHREAANLYAAIGDVSGEGVAHHNIGSTLIKLRRYNEAHLELQQAIKCGQAFGHASSLWKTWDCIFDIERANGKHEAGRVARQQAVATYLAYRRDGGENDTEFGRFCLTVWQSIQQGNTSKIMQMIASALVNPEQNNKELLNKLYAVLAGERDLALTEDQNLRYDEAAELILLLEVLGNRELV